MNERGRPFETALPIFKTSVLLFFHVVAQQEFV